MGGCGVWGYGSMGCEGGVCGRSVDGCKKGEGQLGMDQCYQREKQNRTIINAQNGNKYHMTEKRSIKKVSITVFHKVYFIMKKLLNNEILDNHN